MDIQLEEKEFCNLIMAYLATEKDVEKAIRFIKKHETEILRMGDPKAIYEIALYLYKQSVDTEKYYKRVLELEDPYYSAEFAIHIKKGDNIDDLIDQMIKKEEYVYLMEIAVVDKLLEIDRIRRHILLEILKSKNPIGCYQYAIRIPNAPKELLFKAAFVDKNPDPKYANVRELCMHELGNYNPLEDKEIVNRINELRKSLRNEKDTPHRSGYFSTE